MAKTRRQAGGWSDRLARRMVQWGFLFLFLFPLVPLIYKRLTFQPASAYASWLLPWDPLLALGNLLDRNISALIIGAPLFLLALSLVLGRSFCGWVCPLGTLTDLVQPLAFWHRKKPSRPGVVKSRRNSRLRYLILVLALGGALLSIKGTRADRSVDHFQPCGHCRRGDPAGQPAGFRAWRFDLLLTAFHRHPAIGGLAAAFLVPAFVPTGRPAQPGQPLQPASTGVSARLAATAACAEAPVR